MKFCNEILRSSATFVLCCTMFLSLSTSSYGEIAGPGWFTVQGEPLSTEAAAAYFQQKSSSSATPVEPIVMLAAVRIDNRITELARALQHDPVLMYEYVHNHIDYVPYFGALKGSTLTLLSGAGNDFDQAALLIALLRASGYTADFVFGKMAFPESSYPELASWLDVDQDAQTMANTLYSGGIPLDWYSDSIVPNRVWVRLTIAGTEYLLDPAFKTYTRTTGIDLGQALDYDINDLLGAATNGATITADSVQNMSESELISQLEQYSASLTNAITTEHHNSTVAEIIGGRSINPEYLGETLPTALNYSTSDEIYWTDDVPTEYTATLRVEHVGIDHTFEIPDITAKRLTITYTGSNNLPELRLDGEIIATGTATTSGAKNELQLTIDHPYANSNGEYMDQNHPFTIESGRTYAIVSDFGGTNDNVIGNRQDFLDTYMESGLADTSEQVLGETLNIMGLTWMKETLFGDRLLQELAETIAVRHHTVGLMAQEAGYYIDIPLAFTSSRSRHNIDADSKAHFYSGALLSSGFEHGMLEQLMGSENPGASTVKLLQIANSNSLKIYQVDNSNYSTIRSLLTNYSTSQLDDFQSQVNSGRVLILPEDGQLTLNEWRGKTYLTRHEDANSMSLGLIIGGEYYGGYSGTPGTTSPTTVSTTVQSTSNTTPLPSTSNIRVRTDPPRTSLEPVDMASGAYLYNHTDLVLSGRSSLAFRRSYASNLDEDNGLGMGWSHNYDIQLEEGSNGNPGLGTRTPADMAAMIAAQYLNLDLLKNEDTLTGWMTVALIDKWCIDQLIDNVVTVYTGGKIMQFVLQPDGSYSSPPGITAKLVKDGAVYRLEDWFDSVLAFNSDNRAEYQEDADGNRITFGYTDGSLTTVSNDFNQSLTLNYTGSRIDSVSDSAGRQVSYGYTDDDLTSFTDANEKLWGYGYIDSDMTTLTNPLNITTATNTYDIFGRVATQTVPRQSGGDVTYNFYFSGFRNAEEDPEGHQLIYHFDAKGRSIADENQLGHTISRNYDGQNHIVETTGVRGNITDFEFTGHDQTKTTDALSNETNLIYDTEHHLTDAIDPLTHTVTYGYDSMHHLEATTVYPEAGESITTDSTYYPDGTVQTATDGRNITTNYLHDSYGNPDKIWLTNETAVDTNYDAIGRMVSLTDRKNSTTIFDYDDLGLLETKTDPFSNVTSYTYYDDGSLHTVTDRNNDVTTYDYTPTGKIDTVTYQDLSTVEFLYDQHDRMSDMIDSLGTTNYGRDEAGRVTSTTDANGNTVGYTYDENGYTGLLTTLTYPGGNQVTYTYDELNRLKTVTNWLTQTATYDYDDAGRLYTFTNFNGTVTTYSQDNANRLTGIDSRKSDNSVIASFVYTLDENGNRIGIDKQIPLSASLPGRNDSASYTHNRIDSTATTSYVHDDEGQLSSKTEGSTTTYSFDDAHRLTGLADTATTIYSYDGAGNRLRAVRDGVETRYIYDANGNLLAEADNSNVITRYYIHGAGLLAAITPSDELYCYHFDAVGSTVAISDSSQNVVNSYSYTPFGMILGESETFAQPFKYVGQLGVMAEGSGLYYMRARYYDPVVGRFISEDPLGLDGGDVNLYVYGANNPTLFTDPFGLFVWGAGVSASLGTPVAGDTGAGFLVEGFFNDVATTTEIAGTGGYQITADLGVTTTIAPFANSVNDLSGEAFRLSIRFGYSLDITIPKDNASNFSVTVDLIPGIDYGIGFGEVNAGVFGGQK